MPRVYAGDDDPLMLQVCRQDKIVLERSAVLAQTDVGDFIMCHVLVATYTLIGQAATVTVSKRDSL